MMNDTGYDPDYTRKMIALHAGLTEGIRLVNGEEGEVWVDDVQTNTTIAAERLKDTGGGYFARLKTTLKEVPSFILPAAIYLTALEKGGKADDVLSEDGQVTLFQACVQGLDEYLAKAIETYLPNSYTEFCDYLIKMGLASWDTEQKKLITSDLYVHDYKGLKNKTFLNVFMQLWMEKVARGEDMLDFIKEYKGEKQVLIRSENVKKLQEVLRFNVTDGMANRAYTPEIAISGITHVTPHDDEWKRDVYFYGYFPSEAPMYCVFVKLTRQEQIEDAVHKEWPELGESAALVCKTIAEVFITQGRIEKKMDCDVLSKQTELVTEDESSQLFVKAGRVTSVNFIGATIE